MKRILKLVLLFAKGRIGHVASEVQKKNRAPYALASNFVRNFQAFIVTQHIHVEKESLRMFMIQMVESYDDNRV